MIDFQETLCTKGNNKHHIYHISCVYTGYILVCRGFYAMTFCSNQTSPLMVEVLLVRALAEGGI